VKTTLLSSFHKISSLGGPLIFLIILLFPLQIPREAHVFLGLFVWVVYQWLFTAIPLFATGLMGVALTALTGVTSAKDALAPLSDPLIYLFLGGFFLAKALEVLKLDRKIALTLIMLPWVRGDFKRTVFVMMALASFFSMWVSNTATTAMMLPIVLGLMKSMGIEDKNQQSRLLLSVAFAATIGGLATPIGSPPNIIAIGMLQTLANINMSFLAWMAMAMPIVIILFIVLYFQTIKHFPKSQTEKPFQVEGAKQLEWALVDLTKKEATLILIFLIAIFLWFSPSLISLILGAQHPLSLSIEAHLNPGIVSLFLGSLLFIFPLKSQEKIISQEDAMKIDWGSLLLFGTGLSLGQTLFKTGLADLAAGSVMQMMSTTPFFIFLAALIVFTIFFTEVASNTATANILIPLMIATSIKAEINALVPVLAVAVSSNLAFMLPVATPPNAIVYGSGLVDLKTMARFGLKMNLVSIVVLAILFSIL
jgi:solute carrier family 13 (sodium-dependent dicarboxylate transporter), member 2/3/5